MEMRKECSGHYKLRDHVQEINKQNWPTPQTRDWKGKSQRANFQEDNRDCLPNVVINFPTPRGQDSYERSNWKTIIDANEGGKSQMTLTRKIKYEAGKGRGQLNPDWVCWLMGWPIEWSALEPITKLIWIDWSVDPADTGEIPRVTTEKKDRVNRLKAIGNGQVPQCAATAWEILN